MEFTAYPQTGVVQFKRTGFRVLTTPSAALLATAGVINATLDDATASIIGTSTPPIETATNVWPAIDKTSRLIGLYFACKNVLKEGIALYNDHVEPAAKVLWQIIRQWLGF